MALGKHSSAVGKLEKAKKELRKVQEKLHQVEKSELQQGAQGDLERLRTQRNSLENRVSALQSKTCKAPFPRTALA